TVSVLPATTLRSAALSLDGQPVRFQAGQDFQAAGTGVGSRLNLIDPHPSGGGTFGLRTTVLSNGNVVVTNPQDNFVAAQSGAVYLFSGSTGALLSDLVGGAANDRVGVGEQRDANSSNVDPEGGTSDDWVGIGAVRPLANGNYVVSSPLGNNQRGA